MLRGRVLGGWSVLRGVCVGRVVRGVCCVVCVCVGRVVYVLGGLGVLQGMYVCD